MQHTPWTRNNPASSLTSDRIRTPPPPSNPGKNTKGKGKGAATPPEPPKSRGVRQLEMLIGALTAAAAGTPTADPKGGCFCQARAHPLSPHAPLCRACGLVLCAVNPTQHACPSCGAALLTDTQRASLVARLQTELAETLAREERARAQAADDARRAAGAFPTLAGSPAPAAAAPPPQPQTRTVLSLNAKTKRVTVSAFASPAPSRPASPIDPEPVPARVPRPPAVVPYVSGVRIDAERPYRDLGGDGAVYVPPPSLDEAGLRPEGSGEGSAVVSSERGGKRRAKGRGKQKAKESTGTGDGD